MEQRENRRTIKAHSISAEEILKRLGSDKTQGLSGNEVAIRLTHYGSNIIGREHTGLPFKKITKQFSSPLVIILLIATIISFAIGNTVDAFVILVVVLLNAGIGFSHEFKVEKAMIALKKAVQTKVKVIRDGKLQLKLSRQIVPGDIVNIEAGDNIPADCRIIESIDISVNEASLTGESSTISKNNTILPQSTATFDQTNMLFMGTTATKGWSKAVVIQTGNNTHFGSIAKSVESIVKESAFNKKITRVTKQAGYVGFGVALVVFLLGLFVLHYDFTSIFIVSIAVLVSVIPEGLPTILSIILAVGAKRMARNKAIVKNLSDIETIGVSDVIVTDKTGTLTTNTMTVKNIVLYNGDIFSLEGSGWDTVGTFTNNEARVEVESNKDLTWLLETIVLCNDAHITRNGSKVSIIGEPTEAALLVASEKSSITRESLQKKYQVLFAPPFNSEDKYRSVLVEKDGVRYIIAVGAPEAILERGTMTHNGTMFDETVVENLREQIHTRAKMALRTLAIGYTRVAPTTTEYKENDVTSLSYLGFVGMKDPVRPQVPLAIKEAQSAGIRVIMATGDHKDTAQAIGIEVGITSKGGAVYSQDDIDQMTPQEFIEAVKTVNVFARINPETKKRIAEILQQEGHIVTMTGDGVNDAPALRQADVGVAMGEVGTDAARAASSIILTNDNFATIIDAIKQGRIVFNNISNTTAFLFSTNIAEAGLLLVSLGLGLPLPLLATQILWLNLITDSVGAIPLAFEGEHGDELKKQNLSHKEIVPRKAWVFILTMAVLMIIISVGIYSTLAPDNLEKARTAAFTVVAFTQIFNILNVRSLTQSVFKLSFSRNKYLLGGLILSCALQILILYAPMFQNIFNIIPPTFGELLMYIGLSSLIIVGSELYKTFIARNI